MKRTYTNKMIIQAVENCRKANEGGYGPRTYDILAQQIATDTGLKAPSRTLLSLRVSNLVAFDYLSCEKNNYAISAWSLDVTDKGRELIA